MVYGVILSGGSGRRMNAPMPKQFLDLGHMPVIGWSIKAFRDHPLIDGLVIVNHPEYRDTLQQVIDKLHVSNYCVIVDGGHTRQDSSYNAVTSRQFREDDILLIHDAARPFITDELITRCIEKTRANGAAGVYVSAIDTIAQINNGFVESIPDRNILYHTQTPQGFVYAPLLKAHRNAKKNNLTGISDDISLLLNDGQRVATIAGDYRNIKITNVQDLAYARFLITHQQ